MKKSNQKKICGYQKQILRIAVSFFSVCLCLDSFQVPVKALSTEELPQDGMYDLVDFASSSTDLGSYSTFKAASNAFQKIQDSYDNLGIVKDGTVLQAEYGIVLIASTDACDYNVEFTNDADGQNNYTNGCYGKDAAYLGTSADGTQAEFEISGAVGWGSLSDLTIVPLQNIEKELTSYVSDSGLFYHRIKTEMEDDNFGSIVCIGNAPDYIQDGTVYYSYNGHYFYTSDTLYLMLDDARSGTGASSINPDQPYYDYYQFVSHRTITSVSYETMEDLFENTMMIQGSMDSYLDNDKDSSDDTLTRSQYYGKAEIFWQYQYQYGANALMMIALSANESAYGSSSLAYTRNNLFGHAAYDTDVEKNASRFSSIDNSIYSHARYYISGSYCSPLKTQYHGGYFGNKASGMNVSYASDPYWGEKAAQYYRKLNDLAGGSDEYACQIGIKTGNETVEVYQYPTADSDILYQTTAMPDSAFVILRSESNADGDWYVIQSDATLDENSKVALEYDYNYAADVGYIRQDAVQVLLSDSSQSAVSYVSVTFDAAGGTFPGSLSSVSYEMPAGSDAAAGEPQKDHALFTGWDLDTSAVSADTVFTAQYKEVSKIELTQTPKQDYELNDRIDLSNGQITVHFADGSTQTVSLTTSMVSGFDMTADGDQTVTVSYAGCTAEYAIHVSAEKDTKRAEIKQKILDQIESLSDKETLSDEEIQSVLDLKTEIDENMQPYLTQVQLRAYDALVKKAVQNKIRYVVEKNSWNLGVSGLSLSMPLSDSLQQNQLFPDTYRVSIKNGISAGKKLLNAVAESQSLTALKTFTLTVKKNMETIVSERPLVFSIQKPEGSDDGDVFTVLYYSDGDVEKCYTRQTGNTISFMSYGSGQYLLASRRSSNIYTGEDPVETVTAETSSYDLQKAVILGSVSAIAAVILILWLLHHYQKKKNAKILAEKMAERKEDNVQEKKEMDQMTHALEVLSETQALMKIQEEDKNSEKKEDTDNDQSDSTHS